MARIYAELELLSGREEGPPMDRNKQVSKILHFQTLGRFIRLSKAGKIQQLHSHFLGELLHSRVQSKTGR